jgi:hypothetical protein
VGRAPSAVPLPDLALRRKLTLRAHGRKVVFVKRPGESLEHVLMKAFLWALYLPRYPGLAVEVPIGDRYKPDVVELDALGEPVFWGEAGKVGVEKVAALARRFPRTHVVVAKWATPLGPFEALVREALGDRPREAPFELLGVPRDAERFIAEDGSVTVSFSDLERVAL